MDGDDSLDPKDWSELRALAHRMIDDGMDFLEGVRSHPVYRPVPDEVSARLSTPAPEQPTTLAEVYEEFRETILPYPMNNIHPRFLAWYMGAGTPSGALAEFLAATMNSNVAGGDHAAPRVEKQVVDWMKAMVGMPEDASGLLVSGGSMAGLAGLAVARNARVGVDVRKEGVAALAGPLTVYGSSEVHTCYTKAVELLGLGNKHLRLVAVDAKHRLNVGALERAIENDVAAGCIPLAVVGNAGTINTGAVDDLDAIADVCARHGLWFHVDGAIGAVAMYSSRLRPLFHGIERADSLALDLHKWLQVPFEAGCVLVRDAKAHQAAFSLVLDYIQHAHEGLAGGPIWHSDYGLQLSRRFRALKVWMTIKEHGTARFGRLIDHTVDEATWLSERMNAHPAMECAAEVVLNIVCFRYNPGVLSDAALDELNRTLVLRLQLEGVAILSVTKMSERTWIRVVLSNHRTTREDLEVLLAEIARIGSELAAV